MNQTQKRIKIDWLTYDKHIAEYGLGFKWRAKAAQRAEAFGKTLNLWT